ncbi:MAG: helix-turn-helix transcriptional regulator [Clostridia bacterium]|nr:helix-turn-helix transcriptional regulator [Clostridia bacterium]
MYIDYSKLWKLLIDKDMTKTDLMNITGMSTRVLAKLSKNETVTTDTIVRICAALKCDVSDIMECVTDDRMTLYHRFNHFGKTIDENDLYKTVIFNDDIQQYKVYVSKKAATKSTHIHCKDNRTIYWEQLYPFGGISTPQREEYPLVKPQREKDEIVIVLIKGKPAIITGLDVNGFVSAHSFIKERSDIYVMSQAAFKLFQPHN